jgi:uncharacterized protein YdbL (DUF1318 family)
MKLIVPILFAALVWAEPAVSQTPALAAAVDAGQVGERYDGYMGVVGSTSPEVRRQVQAINIRRRKLYTDLSMRRNVTTELVGMATGCQLLSKLGPGEAYMLGDGVWRRHVAGQAVPLPDYCR